MSISAPTMIQHSPAVEERALAVMDPSMLPESDLPTNPLDCWFWRADWEGIDTELRRGKVVVLSVESGDDVGAAKCAALFCVGSADLLFRHDAQRGRLYLMYQKKQPAAHDPSDTKSAGSPAGFGSSGGGTLSKVGADTVADILTMLYEAPIESLRGLVRVLSVHAGAKVLGLDDADRDVLLSAAREALMQINVSDLLSLRHVVKRHLENLGAEDEDDGDGGDGDGFGTE